MKNTAKLLALSVLVLLFAKPAPAPASDPLDSSYQPSQDCNPADYPSNVAISGPLVKLRRDSGTPAGVAGSSPCASVWAFPLDDQSFQVHVQAPGGGYSALTIVVSSLVKSTGPGGNYTIPAPDATHTSIVPYAENYMDVALPSGLSTTYFSPTTPVTTSTMTSGSSETTANCTGCSFTSALIGDFLYNQNYEFGATITAVPSSTQLTLEANVNLGSQASGNTFEVWSPAYYPDALIPLIDPYYHQTTSANSLSIAAGNNQSYWVDVTPPAAAPPGFYAGTVTIKNGGSTIATLPVLLGLWDWPSSVSSGHMPTTSTLWSILTGSYQGSCIEMYFSCNNANYNGGGSGDGSITPLQQDEASLFLDHRYSESSTLADILVCPGGTCGSFSTWNGVYGGFLNGTSENGITRLLPGSEFTTLNPAIDFENYPVSGTWTGWAGNATTNGWRSKLYNFLCDEPSPEGGGTPITTCISNGTTYHGYTSPVISNAVTALYSFVSGYSNGTTAIDWLVAAINIFDPVPSGPQEPASDYTAWISGSPTTRRWAMYQACGSAGTCTNGKPGLTGFTYPNYDVDGLPVANRIFEWNTQRLGATGELYYAANQCRYGAGSDANCGVWAGGPSISPLNPLISNYDYGGWGDGTLVYYGGANFTLSGCAWTTGTMTCTVPAGVYNNVAVGQGVFLTGFTPSSLDSDLATGSLITGVNTGAGTISFAVASNPGAITSGSISTGYPTNTAVPPILPSMRLKYIMEGMEDYELMNLLVNEGETSIVNTQRASVLTGDFTFNTNATGSGSLTNARCNMGAAVHQITFASASGPNCQASSGGGGGSTVAPANPMLVEYSPRAIAHKALAWLDSHLRGRDVSTMEAIR